MTSNSPESPSKKRKQPINGLKRDQPLFTNRRPQRTLQQPPEFLTDSLNTSYIPSPSPTKSPTRRDVRARPRQALGNGRALADAFKAKPKVHNENEPPSSNRSLSYRSSKPRPKPNFTRANTTVPDTLTRHHQRTSTPSPPRGRALSFTSPVISESSPGRGIAEAYQRIDEEENLAQEDSIDDIEDNGGRFDLSQQERSFERSRSRLQRLRQSPSPMSQKASRRASPRGVLQHDKPTADGVDEEENTAHESDSESGIDYTENVTDTSIDSGSSQYAKDLQRLGALKKGTKVFSKARLGERAGLSAENLQRQNASTESLGSGFSGGSASARNSDPSVNIPKAWGRKATPGKDWLARINSRSGRFTGDIPKRHSSGDQIIADSEKRERSEPIDQWIASAAEIPLPSSEGRVSQSHAFSQGSTPTTAVPRSSSLNQRRPLEMYDDEFTGRFLQSSDSPPIRIRNSALDRIRQREMETLEKRAVTTNRLGELREKSSGESLRHVKSNKSIEEPQQEARETPQEDAQNKPPSPEEDLDTNREGPDHQATPEDSLQDEGIAIPDTPIVVYRSNSHNQKGIERQHGRQSEDKSQKPGRPSHDRKDSHDLLKRLAHATSENASPTRDHADTAQEPPQVQLDESYEQTPQPSKPAGHLKTPIVTGAWVDQTLNDTSQPLTTKANLKTPLVTGAWIDTPLPTGGRGPPMPTPSDQEEQKELRPAKLGAAELIHRLNPNNTASRPKLATKAPLIYSGPTLPKSALAEILEDAKSGNPLPHLKDTSDSESDPTLHLGDSTIASLENLIANDDSEPYSTLLAPNPPSPSDSTHHNNPSPPSSTDPSPSSLAHTTPSIGKTTTHSSSADPQSYTHLLSRLTNLAPSLRASKRQLASLENAVATVPSTLNTRRLAQLAIENSRKEEGEKCNEAGTLHDFLFPCARCGCPGRSSPSTPQQASQTTTTNLTWIPQSHFSTVHLPIPRLWYFPPNTRFPRLTYLGLATLIAYTLYLIEDYARWRYCHRVYAYSMVGYGVDLDAPRPPFVALKVLWRYTPLGTVLAPLYHPIRVVVTLLASLVGWIVGFIFGDDWAGLSGGGAAGAGAVRGGAGGRGYTGRGNLYPGAGRMDGGNGMRMRQPVSNDPRIPKPSWGPDLSLMHDEYL